MRGNIPAHQREKLAAELAQLESLDSNQLRARWHTLTIRRYRAPFAAGC